ncbi:MAG TPA: hypothetical protein PLN52_10675, partial [Opitutaceae bacterium]|nr:hypothetical protein [Opitutaceae bacterium]
MRGVFFIRRRLLPLLGVGLLAGWGMGFAQNWLEQAGYRQGYRPGDRSGTRVWIEGGGWGDEATVRTARETESHSTGT